MFRRLQYLFSLISMLSAQLPSKSGIHGTSINKCIHELNNRILTGGPDMSIKAWTMSSPSLQTATLTISGAYPIVFEEGKTNDTFYSAFSDGRVYHINFDGGSLQLGSLVRSAGTQVLDICNILYSKYIAVLTGSSVESTLIDSSSASVVLTITPTNVAAQFTAIDSLRFTSFLFIGTDLGELEVRHFTSGSFAPQVIIPGPALAVTSIATASSIGLCILGYADGTLKAVDTKAPNTLLATLLGHSSTINSLVWIPNSDFIVSGDQTGMLKMWDINTLSSTPVYSSTYANSIQRISISNIPKRLLLGKITAATGAFEAIEPAGLPCFHTCTGTCGDFSDSSCTACQPGFVLNSNGFCDRDCSTSSQYLSVTNNTCLSCNSACSSCFGGEESQCLTCSGGKVLGVKKECLDTCPDGSYQVNSTHCGACFPSCKTCTSEFPFDCITCREAFYFGLQGNCAKSCASGTYTNDTDMKCHVCNPKCATCTGGSENECSTCTNPSYSRRNSLAQCIDCVNEPHKDLLACNMSRQIMHFFPTTWNYDLYSSASYEVFLPNRSVLKKDFLEINWKEFIEVIPLFNTGENR